MLAFARQAFTGNSSQLIKQTPALIAATSTANFQRFMFGKTMGQVKVGDKIPSATFFERDLNTKVNGDDVFKGKKVVVFGIPGAFTPTCTKKHVPGYVNNAEQFRSKGVDELICLAVNDPYVMDAFCDKYGCTGKVRGLTDVKGDFVKKLGLDIDMTEKLGGVRSQRFAMLVDDGIIKEVLTEEDGTSLSNSSAENMLSKIR